MAQVILNVFHDTILQICPGLGSAGDHWGLRFVNRAASPPLLEKIVKEKEKICSSFFTFIKVKVPRNMTLDIFFADIYGQIWSDTFRNELLHHTTHIQEKED